MTRTIICAFAVVAMAATASGPSGTVDGATTYTSASKHPSTLTAKDVGASIWPAVKRINQSGWVWTEGSWDGSGGRFVILTFVTSDLGRLFRAIADTLLANNHNRFDPQVANIRAPRILFYSQSRYPDLGKYQMQIMFDEDQTDADRDRSRMMLGGIAGRVNRKP
jgi:hypothetical protein